MLVQPTVCKSVKMNGNLVHMCEISQKLTVENFLLFLTKKKTLVSRKKPLLGLELYIGLYPLPSQNYSVTHTSDYYT